ncbi:PLG [Mytilus edulis]|uniref:PLG n=1 Tax=Mytilus edulis TaxID=6550 RepID=A0A8S3QW81_MYTED|nr:PLG [Mytilus edulis]
MQPTPGINYALRRKASQSSTYHSKYAASQAVDGEENTFTATKKQNNAYWSVDLGKAVNVKQINIINRKDCCGKWLKNIAVTVGQNLNSMKHCSKFKGPGKNGQVIELTCKSPIAGRYVKILRSGKGILGLAEVQVIGNTGKPLIPAKPKGKIVKPAKPKGINYALRRKASQSSTYHSKYAASQAVDGEENTFSATKTKQCILECNRLKDIAVTVGLNFHKMEHCSKFKGPGKNGQVIELTCKSPIAGRYVKILRSGKGILSLAEVQVIGHTGKKLIAGKPKGKAVKPPKPKGQQCIMNRKGANYGGNISKTRSGRTCQAWGVQTPQKHKFSKKLADQKNYCRNPDNEPHGPWCYTTDAKKRWEYCAIPYCSMYYIEFFFLTLDKLIPLTKADPYNN